MFFLHIQAVVSAALASTADVSITCPLVAQ